VYCQTDKLPVGERELAGEDEAQGAAAQGTVHAELCDGTPSEGSVSSSLILLIRFREQARQRAKEDGGEGTKKEK
jgi:hypothetical protein